MIVGAAVLRIGGADDDAAVRQCEFLDGKFGSVRRAGRSCCGRLLGLRLRRGTAERRIVPLTGGVAKEYHLWAGNRDASDIQRLREDQRHDFDSHVQRLGGEERRGTEFGVVANGEVFRRERTAEERKADIAQLNFAAQGGGSFFFNGGAELVDGDQKREHENQHGQHAHNHKDNL